MGSRGELEWGVGLFYSVEVIVVIKASTPSRGLRFRVWGLGVRVCMQCARVGAPFIVGIGAYPLVARQHVVPPQPPQLFSIKV